MARNLLSLNPCHSGDVNDLRVVTLHGVNNLTGFLSGRSLVTKGGITKTLDVSLVDGASRTVEINLGSAPLDWLPARPERGVWRGQIEITFQDGTILTWPAQSGSQGFFQIEVLQELQ